MSQASPASRDESGVSRIFPTMKDRWNKLYTVQYWNQTNWMFIKAVLRALLNASSRLTGPARLHMNSPF
jgi:hypothetical protein